MTMEEAKTIMQDFVLFLRNADNAIVIDNEDRFIVAKAVAIVLGIEKED